MNLELKEKVVVVTGASKGIGKATAKQFAAEEAHVIITYANDQETASRTAEEIRAQGLSCQAVRLNLENSESIQKAVEFVGKEFGGIDVLVNNAVFWGGAAPKFEPFEHTSTDSWFSVIDQNLKGTYLVTKAVLPYMRKREWGRLVHVSSNLAEDGMTGGTSYTASKSALSGFSKSLSLELAAEGIFSNVVMPGFTLTESNASVFPKDLLKKHAESIPAKRLGTPEDVANLIVYLGSKANSYVIGETIRVTGGR
ncbi:SDR family NAD(P)-dependent oxidoreductase [Paenibacillus harenae]|uniref:NAD(P)-dependent dehydrogenase (Short-subunit alcohol dehydrogenase family) n=1 Tax=Paenibacillus harenae TaxID=306543 RepID=A0ABT9U2R5_PAEHA|nr:SDR family oxidoreductase [Paenibacillus harenae]MDQ0062914.1 NAD(P)-dependent dehydrogenase (short-subunit alcohol dehydrogenase family) [Paenibacillus harenae]MDQ0113838.1 NAD(P)-dependent dehydrogenase (short-subunit alcohol dehydrogenase family) [Paenibacillus harenae]